jgi:NTP pyrophosphatase (non-canonical NTP hydrolase)
LTRTEINDEKTSIANLRQAVARFIAARNWEPYHTPKNLAMSIAIEAAEIMEHFQWLTPEEASLRLQDPLSYAEVADELADVVIYCLSFANVTGIDISTSVFAKLNRNETRFPVEPGDTGRLPARLSPPE